MLKSKLIALFECVALWSYLIGVVWLILETR